MQYKALHCWDCGTRVIEEAGAGLNGMANLRQVRFGLHTGAYCESPFCISCAEREWTPERIQEFKRAVDVVSPHFRAYRIERVEGVGTLSAPVVGVVR